MGRMDRAQFEAFVRDAAARLFDDNGAPPDAVEAFVSEVGSKFEDAESDAYFAGKDQGVADEIDRTNAIMTGGY